jgi:hypothetical protein
MKKHFAITLPAILVLGYLSVLSVLTFRAKNEYESLVAQTSPARIIELTPELQAQIESDVSTMTQVPIQGVNDLSEESLVFEQLGVPYNTQGLVELLTFK